MPSAWPPPGGIVSSTGIAGLTLGGGIGHLGRCFGLTVDNVIPADVVTADGRLLVASERENPDLFRAIRGGGNFGVCTAFECRLHPVATVYREPMFFEVSQTETILKFYRDDIGNAPEEMGVFPAFQMAPPSPFIPEDRHGDMFVALVACWSGDPAKGEKMFRPVHDIAEVKAEMTGPVTSSAINAAFDDFHPTGCRQHRKGRARMNFGANCERLLAIRRQ